MIRVLSIGRDVLHAAGGGGEQDSESKIAPAHKARPPRRAPADPGSVSATLLGRVRGWDKDGLPSVGVPLEPALAARLLAVVLVGLGRGIEPPDIILARIGLGIVLVAVTLVLAPAPDAPV